MEKERQERWRRRDSRRRWESPWRGRHGEHRKPDGPKPHGGKPERPRDQGSSGE
jgi:hypothetical protein